MNYAKTFTTPMILSLNTDCQRVVFRFAGTHVVRLLRVLKPSLLTCEAMTTAFAVAMEYSFALHKLRVLYSSLNRIFPLGDVVGLPRHYAPPCMACGRGAYGRPDLCRMFEQHHGVRICAKCPHNRQLTHVYCVTRMQLFKSLGRDVFMKYVQNMIVEVFTGRQRYYRFADVAAVTSGFSNMPHVRYRIAKGFKILRFTY